MQSGVTYLKRIAVAASTLVAFVSTLGLLQRVAPAVAVSLVLLIASAFAPAIANLVRTITNETRSLRLKSELQARRDAAELAAFKDEMRGASESLPSAVARAIRRLGIGSHHHA